MGEALTYALAAGIGVLSGGQFGWWLFVVPQRTSPRTVKIGWCLSAAAAVAALVGYPVLMRGAP